MAERSFTQWSPDTCGCVINYYNDDTSFHSTVKTCPKHSSISGMPEHAANVRLHNKKKNDVNGTLKDNADALGIVLADVEGGMRTLPAGFSINYDPNAPVDNDPVIVTVPANISAQKKAQWQNFCDQHFGVGSVTIR
jgi:hypothetical protein